MKTIRGYHDKNKGKRSLYEEYVVLTDTRYMPFVLTESNIFVVQSQRLVKFVRTFKADQTFGRIKKAIAFMILLLSFVAVGGGLLAWLQVIDVAWAGLVRIIFFEALAWAGIAFFVIWHDISTASGVVQHLVKYKNIGQKQQKELEKGVFNYTQLKTLDPFDYLHRRSQKMLYRSIQFREESTYLDTKVLLKQLLRNAQVKKIWRRLGINEQTWKTYQETQISERTMPTHPLFSLHSLLCYSIEQTIITKSYYIEPPHLLLMLFKVYPVLEKFLTQNEVTIQTLQKIVEWRTIEKETLRMNNPFNLKTPYIHKGGIVDAWVYGYTFHLDKVTYNLTQKVINKGGIYGIGHNIEMDQVVNAIQRESYANVLLVGEPGTGSSSVVWGIVQRILSGKVPFRLRNYRVLELDINKLLGYAHQVGGMPQLMNVLGNEMKKAGNILLFIDDFSDIVKMKSENQSAVSDYLLSYIMDASAPVIGTLSFADYQKYIQNKSSLNNAFQRIDIVEPSFDHTFTILTTKIRNFERKFGVYVEFAALQGIIDLTAKYMPMEHFPKKATITLEQACITAQNQGQQIVNLNVVKETISGATSIPITEVAEEETELLLNLEEEIHKKFIDQVPAVRVVVQALQRARTGIRDMKKPIAVFFFLGPTGVGKTYLTQLIGELYFGHKHQMIRIDMPQFKTVDKIDELLKRLEQIKINPFTIILLDEFEKASPEVYDIFLRIFDEGSFTNNDGLTLSFTNTIIVATSNIGSDKLLTSLSGKHVDLEKFAQVQQEVENSLTDHLRPELVNRFDKIVFFKPISVDDLTQITKLLLKDLAKRVAEQNIKLQWKDTLPKKIASQAFSPGMGARPVRRYLQDRAESMIAQYILKYRKKHGKKPENIWL